MKNKLTPFTLHQIHVATDNFSPTRLIGKGSHGNVYKGVLPDTTLVAVKKQSSPLHDNSKLLNELQLLSSIIPPNPHLIVNLLGGLADNSILVTEYLPNGTLDDLLHSSSSSPLHMLTWHNRLKFALQLAKALCYLHAPDVSVVHRDVKPTNVLLDTNWNAKLADFGLATHLDDDVGPAAAAGTIGYIDPNYTTPKKLSRKVDVYSYGVVVLELISGRKAIDVAKSPASVVEWALPLIRERRVLEVCDFRVSVPREMEGVIEVVLRMAERCLAEDEGVRPSMSEVVEVLERLAAEGGAAAPGKYCVGEIVGNWMTMMMIRWRRRKITTVCAMTRG